jgi:uncharacterized protein DUF2785
VSLPWSTATPTTSGVVDALIADLGSPDPALRDDTVYPLFVTWIRDGSLDESLVSIGDRLAAMLVGPAIQARTFATLILGWTVRRGVVVGIPAAVVRRWQAAFAAWWSAEKDLRGYDDQLGWLHAIAHGADTVRAFALAPTAGDSDLRSLLSLVTSRLLTPTDYLFAHAEDDRVAYALAVTLAQPALADHVTWLDPIATAFAAGEPGPVPAWVANTQRTLNSLYVALDRGVIVHDTVTQERSAPLISPARDAVLGRISDILRDPSYWLA